jgi:threonine/homoserine/homoserine lactone efflux protein
MAVITALFSGLGLGFAGSIPVAGPTAVIVAESALNGRPRRGLTIAIGAAIAEGFYALVAFWGLTAVLTSYPSVRPISRVVAGVVLCLVGVYLIRRRAKPASQRDRSGAGTRAHELGFGFTITFFNPTLVVTWTVAVAALHAALPATFSVYDAIPFAIGVSTGIVAWFWVLLRLVSRFRESASPHMLNRVIRATGGVLVAAGVFVAARAIVAWKL